MTGVRLTTTALRMTMNWYVAESMIAERTRGPVEADGRRRPELRHTRALRSGQGAADPGV